MESVEQFVSPHLLEIEAYTPGKQLDLSSGWIKLNTNEAPYLPSILPMRRLLPLMTGDHGLCQSVKKVIQDN